MSTIERLLPSAEQLHADAERGHFIDRLDEELPDSLYRRKLQKQCANGSAPAGQGSERGRKPSVATAKPAQVPANG